MSIHSLSRKYLQMYPIVGGLNLDFQGQVIRVETNSITLVRELENYFGVFVTDKVAQTIVSAIECPPLDLDFDFKVKQPDPGKFRIKEEWTDTTDGRIVRKRLTGMVFAFGNDINIALGPCVHNSNQVVNFVNNRFIQWALNGGALLGHAAGVSYSKRGLAIAGFSGAGKSTLALHLMSRGTTFVSNDRVMIRPGGSGITMYGVAKLPRINPGTILHNPNLLRILSEEEKEEFLSLPPDELWTLEKKYDADLEHCFGENRFNLEATMNGLIILNWQRNSGPYMANRFNPTDRPDLLPAFIKSEGLFFIRRPDVFRDTSAEAYMRILARTKCLEITGDVDFSRAAETAFRFLETGEFE